MLQSKTMKQKEKPIVIANWKMNPPTIGEAKKLFLEIRKVAIKYRDVVTIIAAPFPYLEELDELTTAKHTHLASQNVHFEKGGTYTGEVSASMLRSIGVTHVIVGHSERRAIGETDEEIHQKIKISLKEGLMPILCVGEDKRSNSGQYFSVVESQLKSALRGIPKKYLDDIIITYEPVWAISKGDGKGRTATPHDAYEMKLFIQKVLTHMYDRKATEKVRVLYGGSVNPKNAKVLLADGEVNGFLVGGASLKAKEFNSVLTTAHERR